ncbi:MAG TPA: hypothetical protein VE222_09155, partial [Nitrospiraceae bacterium]|nr:hypothetical protein [Nitrospiraceae bacterium]
AEAERKFIDTFTRAGAKYHQFTYEEFLSWLRLAQQTAWKEYVKISPSAEKMLLEVVETILDSARTR